MKTKRLRWPYRIDLEGVEWVLKKRRLFREDVTVCRARTWDAMRWALQEQNFIL